MLAVLLAAAAAATPLKLPGVPAPVIMDYLAASGAQVWVPAGNTGKVFVLEGGKFRQIEGFPTRRSSRGFLMGPSSVSLGGGYAYVGNRGDEKVCAIDAATLEKKGCAQMPGSPDGVFYVAPAREVWVTTPRQESLQILDVKDGAAPKVAGSIALDGEPEGYAVDAGRGLVFTNLEDRGRTLAIDVKTRKVVSTFDPGCGKEGPRGLALDPGRGVLFVACATAGVVALDERAGAKKGRLEAGEGVDNIDYLPARRLLYAAAGRAERLTVARLEDDGALKTVTTARVGKGSRVVVATADGTAYAADSLDGELWVLEPQ